MQPESKDVLKKQVEVDETLVGGYLEGQRGRSLEGQRSCNDWDRKNCRRPGWKYTLNSN